MNEPTDPRDLRAEFETHLREEGGDSTFSWLVQALRHATPGIRSTSSILVVCTGHSDALSWLEANVGSPVTEHWGTAAALADVSWNQILDWLERGGPHCMMALDALVAFREPAPNMSPLAQIAAPSLSNPPEASELEAALVRVLQTRKSPRIQKSIEAVRSAAPEILEGRPRRVRAEDLDHLYLDPDGFQDASPILERHEKAVSGFRQSLQRLRDRLKGT